MKSQKKRDVIGLIDGENYLPLDKNKYPVTYGVPENARGRDYLKEVNVGDIVLGYKTKMYRTDSRVESR